MVLFSLNGGCGRTTLATELASVLASHGRHRSLAGERPLRVVLADLDLSSPTVGIRMGLPCPTLAGALEAIDSGDGNIDRFLARHPTGARVLVGERLPPRGPDGALDGDRAGELLTAIDETAPDLVLIDVAPRLDQVTVAALGSAHEIHVVMTPTAGGIYDAYRTTAQLRRLGLGHRLRYVVNRARGPVDIGEVMADLAGRLIAVIPDDPHVDAAENRHSSCALGGEGPAASAILDLAALVELSASSACERSEQHRSSR